MAEGGRSSVLDRSTGDLIRRLIDDANGLVELQIRLAKLEAKENLLAVLGGGKLLAVAAALGLLAAIGLVMFMIAGLWAIASDIIGWTFLGLWFWALVVTIVLGVAAALFGWKGFKRAKISPLERTRETLREDIEWLRQPMKPNNR